MHARRIARSGCRVPGLAFLAAAVIAGLAVTGCGNSSPAKAASPVRCGTARTAANTPVEVLVDRGKVPCSTAMSVERAYVTAIREGKVAGNGGGSPVSIDGWTCRGFTTPQVDETGNVSKCVKSGIELLAILNLKTSS